LGIPEAEAANMLKILSCSEDDAQTFWSCWRAETALADPEWLAEMGRLVSGSRNSTERG
jgi:hypothetical protein